MYSLPQPSTSHRNRRGAPLRLARRVDAVAVGPEADADAVADACARAKFGDPDDPDGRRAASRSAAGLDAGSVAWVSCLLGGGSARVDILVPALATLPTFSRFRCDPEPGLN